MRGSPGTGFSTRLSLRRGNLKHTLFWISSSNNPLGQLELGDVNGLSKVQGGDVDDDALGEILGKAFHFERVEAHFKEAAAVLDTGGFTADFNRDVGVQGFVRIDSVEIHVEDVAPNRVMLDFLDQGQTALVRTSHFQLDQNIFAGRMVEKVLNFTR